METMNQTKPKSVIINGDLHQQLKNHCKERSLKIGSIIQELIRLYLYKPKQLRDMIEEMHRNND